jgi:autotransporter family porin
VSVRALVAALACAAAWSAACTIDAQVARVSTDAGGGGHDGAADTAADTGADVAADVGAPTDVGMLLPPFTLLPAGSTLPDEATCAARVRRSGFEPRPDNTTANQTVPTAAQLAGLERWNSDDGFDNRALGFEARVTGAFTGTTDELLQWVACKWGFDEDHLRAEAVVSSNWTQGRTTDFTTNTSLCPPDAATRATDGGVECAQTYGIFQIVWQYHKQAWPMFRDSTPGHLDYIFGLRRVCFEGWDMGQAARAPAGIPYGPNDEWGCVGAHFSGEWYDKGANVYISAVQGQIAERAWTKPGF